MHTDTTILTDTDTEHMALSLQDELALTNDRLVLLEFSIGLVDRYCSRGVRLEVWGDMNVSKEEPRVFRLEFECHIFGRLYMLMCHLQF